jgi:hypothetical protein
MTRFLGNMIRWFLLAFVLLALVFFFLLRANAAVPKQAGHGRPFDFPNYVNPRMYQMGYVQEASLVHPTKDKTWTLVTWKPSFSPLLYDERLLFCGDVQDKLVNLTTTTEVVIVYSRAITTARLDSPPPNVVACRSLDFVRLTDTNTP